MFCDFCHAPIRSEAEAWSYEAKPFIKEIGPFVFQDDGKWCACDTCAAIIETGNRAMLEKRSLQSAIEEIPGVETDQEEISFMIHDLHSEFWKHKREAART